MKCDICGERYHTPKKHIQIALKHSYKHDTCSMKCRNVATTKAKVGYSEPIKLNCENCNKMFIKKICEIKKTKHHFCSKSCAAIYNNTHKTKGTRRSKLEAWLEDQLPKLYPDLEFHFNRKDAINSELDIYIPLLNLAFELNGIFHYEPIFGESKLNKIQNNDHRKFQACLERSIELCIIDTSSQKYFKEKSSKKYLNIITNLVNSKLESSKMADPL